MNEAPPAISEGFLFTFCCATGRWQRHRCCCGSTLCCDLASDHSWPCATWQILAQLAWIAGTGTESVIEQYLITNYQLLLFSYVMLSSYILIRVAEGDEKDKQIEPIVCESCRGSICDYVDEANPMLTAFEFFRLSASNGPSCSFHRYVLQAERRIPILFAKRLQDEELPRWFGWLVLVGSVELIWSLWTWWQTLQHPDILTRHLVRVAQMMRDRAICPSNWTFAFDKSQDSGWWDW